MWGGLRVDGGRAPQHRELEQAHGCVVCGGGLGGLIGSGPATSTGVLIVAGDPGDGRGVVGVSTNMTWCSCPCSRCGHPGPASLVGEGRLGGGARGRDILSRAGLEASTAVVWRWVGWARMGRPGHGVG
jgi:hypothetical protein